MQQALYTYLKTDTSTIIEGAEFAQRFMNPEESDDFVGYMGKKGFPESAIVKDTKAINRKLARRRLGFTNDVKITAPADTFAELVKVEATETHRTLVIQGALVSLDK